jgi:ribosomal-protein-alanine acetyltransferase
MGCADIHRVLEIAGSLTEAPRWTRENYTSALDPAALPARIALVADAPRDGVLGFLVTFMVPPQAELESVAVSKQAQRQGIGACLFAELLRILKERQITEVMLEVRESNHPAQAFYRSLGFDPTGRRTSYYSEPKEDAILLRRSVG